ncbi:MAG: hypothetical protein ACXADH_18960 [Candidatus Kariarchaeaceae archaeon]|jgi:hypothetical protein
MSEIKVNNITNYDGSSGPVLSGITTREVILLIVVVEVVGYLREEELQIVIE